MSHTFMTGHPFQFRFAVAEDISWALHKPLSMGGQVDDHLGVPVVPTVCVQGLEKVCVMRHLHLGCWHFHDFRLVLVGEARHG